MLGWAKRRYIVRPTRDSELQNPFQERLLVLQLPVALRLDGVELADAAEAEDGPLWALSSVADHRLPAWEEQLEVVLVLLLVPLVDPVDLSSEWRLLLQGSLVFPHPGLDPGFP